MLKFTLLFVILYFILYYIYNNILYFMNIIDDIKPLSFFKQKSGEIINRIKATKRPTFITVNGNVQLVVQDAKSYQEMIDFIEDTQNKNKIFNALNDVENNNVRPAEEEFNDMETLQA